MSSFFNESLQTDAVVIGMGVLGLVLAKRLLDLGQTVVVLDSSSTLAMGASSRNMGWLHQGTTHALSADDSPMAQSTVKKLQYGHDFYQSYAPECFDEPLLKTYAVTHDYQRAAYARDRWSECGVPFKELSAAEFRMIEPGISPDQAAFFEVADSRLNNRLLFMKLYTEIRRKGAIVLTQAQYEYDAANEIHIASAQGSKRLKSRLFFYTTGANIGDSYTKLTGSSLGVKHYKSHLLFVPRITNTSIIGLDRHSPIVINHGQFSVVNRAHDDVLSPNAAQPQVDPEEVRASLQALAELYPASSKIIAGNIRATACLKPTIPPSGSDAGLNIEQSIYEPQPNHIFALPGKMTAAPYVADEIIKQVAGQLDVSAITPRPFDQPLSSFAKVPLSLPR